MGASFHHLLYLDGSSTNGIQKLREVTVHIKNNNTNNNYNNDKNALFILQT